MIGEDHHAMEPRISPITLGVADLARSPDPGFALAEDGTPTLPECSL